MTPLDITPPSDNYPGMTRLRLSDTRAIVCMGTGPDVDRAVRDKASQVEREAGR